MYDFDLKTDRRNTGSLKWDIKENELPLWVADMDFETVPEVKEALIKRAEAGIFGYAVVTPEWYDSIIKWWEKRHNFSMKKEWMIFCTGVVPAISCVVKRMTNTGDNVVVQTPVYDIFFHSIENHGRHVLENELVYKAGQYEINFTDLEEKLSNPLTTLMILCNPHNPIGKIWSREELTKIGLLCKKHHVTLLVDEIHCDLTMPQKEYVPFGSLEKACIDNAIICLSASKTFNLAGLQSAIVVIPDEKIRNIMERGLNSDEIAEPNAFAIDGVVAAFTYGEKWLDELRQYLWENRRIATEFIEKEIKGLVPVYQEATYLMWVDIRDICDNSEELCQYIRQQTGLFLSNGKEYRGDGRYFIRINLACQKSTLVDALNRLKTATQLYTNHI